MQAKRQDIVAQSNSTHVDNRMFDSLWGKPKRPAHQFNAMSLGKDGVMRTFVDEAEGLWAVTEVDPDAEAAEDPLNGYM